MMTRGGVIAGLVVLASFVGAAHARGQTECAVHRIAFFQLPAILASIPRYAARDSDLAVYVDRYNTDAAQQQAARDSITAAYREKSVLLTPSGRTLELAKLRDQDAEIARRVEDLQQALGMQRQRLLQPIEVAVQAIVDSVRADLKCDIMFDLSTVSGVVSVKKSLDVTQKVIDRIRASADTAVFGSRQEARSAPKKPPS